jgi:RNA polymerase sigma factor (sigma-70 family)
VTGYDELWARHSQAVLGYLVRRCEVREDAADLLAETFLVAWRRLGEVPGPPGDRPWLFAVAANVLANHRRGLRRRSRATRALREQLGDLVTPEPSIEVLALREALARLPGTDREVLTLAAWEGLSAREIGQVLGLGTSAVSTRQSRARARLRELLGEGSVAPPAPIAPPGPRTLRPAGMPAHR